MNEMIRKTDIQRRHGVDPSWVVGRLIMIRDRYSKTSPVFHLLCNMVGLIRERVREEGYPHQLQQIQGMIWHKDELLTHGLDVNAILRGQSGEPVLVAPVPRLTHQPA